MEIKPTTAFEKDLTWLHNLKKKHGLASIPVLLNRIVILIKRHKMEDELR